MFDALILVFLYFFFLTSIESKQFTCICFNVVILRIIYKYNEDNIYNGDNKYNGDNRYNEDSVSVIK